MSKFLKIITEVLLTKTKIPTELRLVTLSSHGMSRNLTDIAIHIAKMLQFRILIKSNGLFIVLSHYLRS